MSDLKRPKFNDSVHTQSLYEYKSNISHSVWCVLLRLGVGSDMEVFDMAIVKREPLDEFQPENSYLDSYMVGFVVLFNIGCILSLKMQ